MNKLTDTNSSSQLIDWAALSSLYDNRQDFIYKLLGVAHASLAEMPANIRQAVQLADYNELAFLAHGLKGSACNLEVPKLLELAGHTEAEARLEHPEAIPLAEELAGMVACLMDELAGHLDKGSGTR